MRLLLSFLLLTISIQLTAQATGNVNRAKGNANFSEGNYNYNKDKNYNTPSPSITAPTSLPNARWIDDRTVILEVNALSNQKADEYIAIFNIKQIGRTAEEADRLLNQRFDGFVTAATAAGVPRDAIYLDMISFVPVYEYEVEKKVFSKKTYNEVPKGFEIQQNIHIQYDDSRVLSKLVSAAAKNEIYDIVKVDYFVNNTEEIYHEMREKAAAYLSKEVEQFSAMGLELDAAYRIITEEERSYFPVDRYSSYQAFSSQSLDGTAKGRINNADKATTMFYDKVTYDNFQVIVNPSILEPVVQYLYNLKIKFRLKQPDPQIKVEKKREFVWLTPDGRLQTLKIEDAPRKVVKPEKSGTVIIPEND